MTTRPVAHYLTHFDVGEVIVHPLAEAVEQHGLIPSLWAEDPEEEDNSEALLEEAREAGRAEGAEAAQMQAAAEMERLRQEFEEVLAAERQKWLSEEADVIKDRLATALQLIEDNLAECVARVLRPFIVESLRRQMIGELVEHIGSMIASHETTAIKISGPGDLLAIMQEKLAGVSAALTYEESSDVDVRVMAGQTTIETRLKAWIDLVSTKLE